jgi:hypothetical protein
MNFLAVKIKAFALCLLSIITYIQTQAQVSKFQLGANNVTVICDNADVGDTGNIGGEIYTKRSKDQITTSNA